MTNILQKGNLILCFGKISKVQAIFNDTVILDPQGCKRLSDCITLNAKYLSLAKIEFQNLIELGFEIEHQSNDCYILNYNEELLLIYDEKINSTMMANKNNIWTISMYLHELQNNFYILTGNNLNYRIHKCSCCR